MSSISKITGDIINQTPFLRELLSKNLINISALARKILPEIEQITGEKVKEGAVLMAIKRITFDSSPSIEDKIREALSHLGDIMVRVGLTCYAFENSKTIKEKEIALYNLIHEDPACFINARIGLRQTTYIISSNKEDDLERIFMKDYLIKKVMLLASVSLTLPAIYNEVIGTTYYILKQLAWGGINIVEIVTTENELSIVVHEKDVDQAFKILMGLKRRS
jgi:hypothetical protein